ncbi:MAG: prephenate dehydratase [Bacteroidales bacterium]|jgi:prephenate dehydratase|nr:prephenate dehydratase [Bacteroidales bacterium]MBQ5784159.1 prephenate dehydratase [Bacteroidales bacterium]MBR6540436.1 prephenate dehydratase [Bacteroidales bacterium]
MKRKVAIQGVGGCNHHIAAKLFFKGDQIVNIDCDTFKELADCVVKDPSVLGIMAIENTIAGSLLQNYQIIRDSKLVIVGEYKLRIKHALVAMPGVELKDIKEINTHPMAFMQCQDFLNTLPNVKLVEKEDTAGSAKWIKENNLRDHAAICPSGAAELYGMNILADGIETNKRNFTRFLILANKDVAKDVLNEICSSSSDINKSSLVFTLPHTSGSLSKVLTILSFYDMNLSMIQSLPIVGEEWRYRFYINLGFVDYTRYRQAIDAIIPLTNEFGILGEYVEGEQSVQ